MTEKEEKTTDVLKEEIEKINKEEARRETMTAGSY